MWRVLRGWGRCVTLLRRRLWTHGMVENIHRGTTLHPLPLNQRGTASPATQSARHCIPCHSISAALHPLPHWYGARGHSQWRTAIHSGSTLQCLPPLPPKRPPLPPKRPPLPPDSVFTSGWVSDEELEARVEAFLVSQPSTSQSFLADFRRTQAGLGIDEYVYSRFRPHHAIRIL